MNTAGEGSASNQKIVTAVGRPGTPTSLSVSSYTATSFTLSWDAPEENGGSNNLLYRVKLLEPEEKELAAHVEDKHYEVVVADENLITALPTKFRVKA